MEVIYEGVLERNDLLSGREWKRGYCVFRKHPATGNKVLDFFKDNHWQKSEPRAVCNLISDYEVSHSSNSTKKRFVFVLRSVDKHYELGAPSELLRSRWMDELINAKDIFSIQNVIQTFNVVLLNADYAVKYLKGYTGTCQLLVTDAEVVLIGGPTKIHWKFSTIRRYKSQTGTFVLEVGRKAPTGEGEFRFDTVDPIQLFDILDKAVKTRMRVKGIEVGTITPSTETAPKPPSFLPPPIGGRLNSPSRPVAPAIGDEYSHLNQPSKTPTKNNNSDYDKLFTSGRLANHRMSEPTLPPFLNNLRPLTSDSKISVDNFSQEEEPYEDMKAAKARRIPLKIPEVTPTPAVRSPQEPKPAPRPQPPPRVKPALQKSFSTPLEDNTYDSPMPVTKTLDKNSNQLADYDSLFTKNSDENTANVAPDSSEYSHLNHGPVHTNKEAVPRLATASNDINRSQDSFKTKPRPPPVAGTRKSVARPQRAAPGPPPGRNVIEPKGVNRNKSLSSSGGNADNLILQLKKRNFERSNKEAASPDTQASFELYDSPRPIPEGYNEVGELIPGEYRRIPNITDADGYVTVPDSAPLTEDGIYQVPKTVLGPSNT